MEYRELPRGGERISVIGVGTSVIGESEPAEAQATFEEAFASGINYVDLAAGHGGAFPALGAALRAGAAGRRGDLMLQVHFGNDFDRETGAYAWTGDLETMRRSVDWQLSELGTDYIDFAFIHCVDAEADLESFVHGGALDHVIRLRDEGVVRHLGLSSHTPSLAHRGLDLGVIDMLMFSVNPVYDYGKGDYGIGEVPERQALYRRCEAEGVGIAVMKPFAGGQLLDARTSPFGAALTPFQCLQYALDKPAVLTVLPGVRSRRELWEALAFLEASPEERDYAVLSEFAPVEAEGACVYCNHCQPCPAGLNVALINKYYDLDLAGDPLAAGHYAKLEPKAGDCVGCGHCDERCPFKVAQSARMREIAAHFGA